MCKGPNGTADLSCPVMKVICSVSFFFQSSESGDHFSSGLISGKINVSVELPKLIVIIGIWVW